MRYSMRKISVLAAASAIGLVVGAGPADASARPLTADPTGCSNGTAYLYTDGGSTTCYGKGAGSVLVFDVTEVATANACITYVISGNSYSLKADQSSGTLFDATITYVNVTGCANT